MIFKFFQNFNFHFNLDFGYNTLLIEVNNQTKNKFLKFDKPFFL
jgi:hypothetical protein